MERFVVFLLSFVSIVAKCLSATPCCPPAKIIHANLVPPVNSRSTAARSQRFAPRHHHHDDDSSSFRVSAAAPPPPPAEPKDYSDVDRSEIEKIIAEAISDSWKGRRLQNPTSDEECLAHRDGLTTWKYRVQPYWELQSGHTEADFCRFFHDMTTEDDYWKFENEYSTVPKGEKVIAISVTGEAPGPDWIIGSEHDVTVLCEENDFTGLQLVEALKNRKAWAILLVDEDFYDSWKLFAYLFFTSNAANCGTGCRLSHTIATGDALADVYAALADTNVTYPANPWIDCVPCEAPPPTVPPSTTTAPAPVRSGAAHLTGAVAVVIGALGVAVL